RRPGPVLPRLPFDDAPARRVQPRRLCERRDRSADRPRTPDRRRRRASTDLRTDPGADGPRPSRRPALVGGPRGAPVAPAPGLRAEPRWRSPRARPRLDERMSLVRRRILLVVPTLVGVATLVFAFLHLVPGDPVEIMLGESAAPADAAALRHELGLDRPLPVQYVTFLGRAARGDLGQSRVFHAPVGDVIAARYPATL